jgi:glucokinase
VSAGQQHGAPLAIGIDLGGSQVRAALIDRAGKVLKRSAVATEAAAGPDIVIEQLCAVAGEVGEGIDRSQLAGIGVAAPGPLDSETGVVLGIPTIAGFVDFPLAERLTSRLATPVTLENDGIAAALGEWRFGAGQGHKHLVYVTVSTGIGGGIISDGRVLRGRKGMAGHIGHMTIVRDGALCACGNRGCWEAYGSGTALAQRAQARSKTAPGTVLADGRIVDARGVFDAERLGDRLARELVAEEASILGVGIVSLLHLYSPEVVILGGGLAHAFDALYPGIASHVAEAAMPAFRDAAIVRAALTGNSGLIGAASMVFDAVPATTRA